MCKFFEDFNFFWGKIKLFENFSFARYADGEVMLMEGKCVDKNTQAFLVDNWFSDNKLSKLGIDLHNSLFLNDNDFYYAISSKTDNIMDYNFLSNRIINKKNITFANLWINANYEKTFENIKNINRDVVLICNENCNVKNMPFNVIDFLPFPNNCVNFWESQHSLYFKTEIINLSTKYYDTLFIVCCGPASAVIINNMFISNKNNTYVDFGSALDFLIHGKITRPYMVKNSTYSFEISQF